MNFDVINKRPVIILSTPRSGSTILAHNILAYFKERKEDILFFNEMISRELNGRENTNFDDINRSNNYILKVHLWDLLKYFPDKIKDLVKNHGAYLIRIRRKDFTAQLLSYYIEHKRQMWSYTKDNINQVDVEDIDFDHMEMKKLVPLLHLYNTVLDKLEYDYDMDVFYEDLFFEDDKSSLKTPKPNNYKELYELCKSYARNPQLYVVHWSERKFAYKLLPDLKIG